MFAFDDEVVDGPDRYAHGCAPAMGRSDPRQAAAGGGNHMGNLGHSFLVELRGMVASYDN
jgi:hypothetical protein